MTKNILIVDDEVMILELIKRSLEDHDYHCFLAENADEALAHVKSETIDLALLDINMPGRSGVELLQEIKALNPRLAVIMETAADDYDTAMRCMDLGADDYIVKPFNPSRILISVRNSLEKKALSLENYGHQVDLEKKLSEQTEKLKASQSMLIQQEKLAAIGQLAAGVAHEINNPLGYISSNLSSLSKYSDKLNAYFSSATEIWSTLPPDQQQQLKGLKKQHKIDYLLEDLPDLITDARDGADRIKEIVLGLKCFSRSDGDISAPVDINSCLESAITIVWNEIKYNSELERDFDDVPFIEGFQQQIAQVFMNLLVNASHAITEKGLIQLKTRQENNMIIVTVSDNGSGIPEKNLSKIFDPFFTTKDPGKGTGLGMSIAREIIEKHRGTITVSSVVGTGTTFTISLPIAEKKKSA